MGTIHTGVCHPIFFERNRVFRVYKGGKLFHEFFGDKPCDGNYPEEWIASSVKALNKGSSDPREGVSRVEGGGFFDELLRDHGPDMLGARQDLGILVKILDSAIRLPVQVHPDKAFSRKYFNSSYGKAEMWLVLATREDACIYMGFRERITEDTLCSAIMFSETDKNAMERLLNRIPVKKGDVFFIPPKLVHAIGYGCLILEIQEPTDFTIQPEAWCGNYRLSEYEMYLGLSQDDALKCFDFSVYGSAAEKIVRKTPQVYRTDSTLISESLIGPQDTDCFSVRRHRIRGGEVFLSAPSVCIVTEGRGALQCGEYTRAVGKGDYFFLPFATGENCLIKSDSYTEIVECLPPETEKDT